MGVEIEKGAGSDQGFTAALAARKKKGNAGDLLGDGIDGAIDPDDLLVGADEARSVRAGGIFAAEPGEGEG